jgi:hypothetical protein
MAALPFARRRFFVQAAPIRSDFKTDSAFARSISTTTRKMSVKEWSGISTSRMLIMFPRRPSFCKFAAVPNMFERGRTASGTGFSNDRPCARRNIQPQALIAAAEETAVSRLAQDFCKRRAPVEYANGVQRV